jgi:hypothetical protein
MIEVVPAKLGHVLSIWHRLGSVPMMLAQQANGDPRQTIARTFHQSRDCRTLRLDGRAVAVYGLISSLLSQETTIWLLASPEVRRSPKAFLAACHSEFRELTRTGTRMVGYIAEHDLTGVRFAAHWGFRMEGGEGGARRAVLDPSNVIPIRRGPPFIVYGLPRSRTRWLAEFLTYGGWTCHHQAAMSMRSVSDVRRLFRPGTGSSEPGASLGWRVLHHLVPGIRAVVVRRPVEDSVRSMCRVDLQGVGHYDPATLLRLLGRESRALDEIAAQPGTLSVDFEALKDEVTCARVFEHCLPYSHDSTWWGALKDRNIQCDVPGTLRYYLANLEAVTEFKRACWRELRRIAYLQKAA